MLHNYEVTDRVATLNGYGYEVAFSLISSGDTANLGKVRCAIIGGLKKPSYYGYGTDLTEATYRALQDLVNDLDSQRASHQAATDELAEIIRNVETYDMYKARNAVQCVGNEEVPS